MAYYLVSARAKGDLDDLKTMLDRGDIRTMRPFGTALDESLRGARRAEPDRVVWEEQDYCTPPLAMERASVLDRYFEDIEVESRPPGARAGPGSSTCPRCGRRPHDRVERYPGSDRLRCRGRSCRNVAGPGGQQRRALDRPSGNHPGGRQPLPAYGLSAGSRHPQGRGSDLSLASRPLRGLLGRHLRPLRGRCPDLPGRGAGRRGVGEPDPRTRRGGPPASAASRTP